MAKVKVSTHDYDTKDIDVFLDGNTLHINIGSDENQVDLSTIIPQTKDFQLTSGSFNKDTKAFDFIISHGSEEKTVSVPVQDLIDIIEIRHGEDGVDGQDGRDGRDGLDGKSAYDLAVKFGYIGTVQEWLDSLKGKSAYQIWLDEGNQGTKQDFLDSLKVREEEKIEYTDAFGDPVLNAF